MELGKLAEAKASSEDVRQFGRQLLDNQTKTNDGLKRRARC